MSVKLTVGRRLRTSLAAVAVGGLAVFGTSAALAPTADATPGVSQSALSDPSSQIRIAAPGLTRGEMLARAATWLTANGGAQVPYSQVEVWSDGYRQDCSGYVSMTLGLGGPGPNTVGLANDRSLTTPIGLGDLTAGDLLIDADGSSTTRHVVIFEGWTDDSHTAYSAFEQRGGHGTDHRVLDYGLDAGSEYKPYRPVNLTD